MIFHNIELKSVFRLTLDQACQTQTAVRAAKRKIVSGPQI